LLIYKLKCIVNLYTIELVIKRYIDIIMKKILDLITLFNFIIFISSLCIINRFIYYFLNPQKMKIEPWFSSSTRINWESTIFLIILIILAGLMVLSYFLYNSPRRSFPGVKTIINHNIEEKSHSTMFWGVICYPLILCPLSDELILFIMTLSILILFTFIFLKHINEVVLPPLIIISGQKLFMFKDKDEIFYLLSSKNIKDFENQIKNGDLNIKCINVTTNIFKEIV